MKKKTLRQLIQEESKTSEDWRTGHERKDDERFVELHSNITDVHDSIPPQIDSAVETSIKKHVNGKIDSIDAKVIANTDITKKTSNNVWWLMLIGGFLVPAVLGAFAYILQWEVQTSNMVAATNSGLQLLESQLSNSSTNNSSIKP